MKSADLVRMANQITDYFELYPKPEAVDGIAKHIHNMWEPRMRNELKAILDEGGDGLNRCAWKHCTSTSGDQTPPEGRSPSIHAKRRRMAPSQASRMAVAMQDNPLSRNGPSSDTLRKGGVTGRASLESMEDRDVK